MARRRGFVRTGYEERSCFRTAHLVWPASLFAVLVFTFWSYGVNRERGSLHLRNSGVFNKGILQGTMGAPTTAVDTSLLTPFNASTLKSCNHLIVVCGHAITTSESLADVATSDAVWSLLPYQRKQDLPASFVAHVRAGVAEAQQDPRSLLVFSGGQTRSTAGPKSEGGAYWAVAEHFDWWGATATVRHRAVVEDYARDSFENLLFAVGRFKEVVGQYPSKFTVVGYAFKRDRFATLHAPALGIAPSAFRYVGLDPPPDSKFNLAAATKGEYENALRLFSEDPYGCNSPLLKAKRLERNPYVRAVPYSLSCPELRKLLEWCGPGLFPDPLPWD